MNPYDFIRNAIIEGDYGPGQRLTEESLAAELQTSRTPIREALKRLETEGLITPLKRGVCVRTFSKEDIRQIYDIRALLEGYTESQAALHRTEKDLHKLTQINKLYSQAIYCLQDTHLVNLKEIARLNNKFHRAILLASKNDYLQFLISKVFILPLVFRSFYWYDKQEIYHSMEVHQTILEAIQHSDPDRAKSAMFEHIYKGRDHVLRHLPSSDETKNDEESL